MNITEYGQLKANVNADDSFVAVPSCSSFSTAGCQDKGSATLGNTVRVTGFTFDGVVTTLGTSILVTDPQAIQEAIEAVIAEKEINVYVRVEYTGGKLYVTHRGQKTLSAVTYNTPGTITLTRTCTTASYCDFVATAVPEGLVSLEVDGVSEDFDPGTYTTAAQFKTELETLLTAVGLAYDSVTVVDGTAANTYDVTISAPKNTVIKTNTGVYFQEQNCALIFHA